MPARFARNVFRKKHHSYALSEREDIMNYVPTRAVSFYVAYFLVPSDLQSAHKHAAFRVGKDGFSRRGRPSLGTRKAAYCKVAECQQVACRHSARSCLRLWVLLSAQRSGASSCVACRNHSRNRNGRNRSRSHSRNRSRGG